MKDFFSMPDMSTFDGPLKAKSEANGSGPWILTFTGRKFHLLDPQPEDISLLDIAHSLATQTRFTGHCRVPYHIADHCIRVAEQVAKEDPKQALAALMHDASEAYLVDLPRPLKHFTPLGPPYLEIEANVERAIARKFNLPPPPMSALIKKCDNILLMTEKRDLLPESPFSWGSLDDIQPLPERIIPRGWADAKQEFWRMALRLLED